MTHVREHITDRASKARLRLEARRGAKPLVVYLAGLGVAALCFGFIASNLPGGGGFSSTRAVAFTVRDATGVVPQRGEIRMKGIPAGTITRVAYEDGHAVVEGEIQEKWGPIYNDARAALRPNTPLQDVYLDIVDRGSAAAGPAKVSDPLPMSQTSGSVNVSDVLQTFQGNTRARLRSLLTQFGAGVDGRGTDLRTAFVNIAPFLDVVGRLAEQLADRERQTRTLVHNSALLTEELGWRDRALRTLVEDGGQVVQVTADGSADLESTLAELPQVLEQLDASFTTVRGVLPDVDRALQSLDPVARRLPAALQDVERLGEVGRPAVTALQPSVRSLTPLARELRPLSDDLSEAITTLRPQVGAIDHVTRDLAACGYTLQRFFHWTASVFALGDNRGEAPRGDAAIGLDTPGIVKAPRVAEAPACAGGSASNGIQPLIVP